MFSEKDLGEVFDFNYLNKSLQNDNDLENHKDLQDCIENSSIKNEIFWFAVNIEIEKLNGYAEGIVTKNFVGLVLKDLALTQCMEFL